MNFVSRFPLINAVLLKLQRGNIFYSIISGSDSIFVINAAGFSSFLADIEVFDYHSLIDFLATTKELPQYFHLYDPPIELINFLSDDYRFNIKVRDRIQLQYLGKGLVVSEGKLMSGFSIQKINSSNFSRLDIFNLSLESKFWSSEEDFLSNGYGFCVMNAAGSPVSICYASCIANGLAEIDVATLEGYQQNGLARAVVSEFVNYSLQNGITPNWDCFVNNHASLKTAERLGFKQTHSYKFLSVFKNNEQ